MGSYGARDAVAGRTLVNLGTSGPDAAKTLADGVAAAGGAYIDGAIQAAPSQMGEPDTPVLLSGPRGAYDAVEPVLRILAGNLVYLGEATDAVAYMDLATLSYVYGSYAGFLHGARIAEATGIDPTIYGKLVKDISPSFGAFFEHQAGVIASGDFSISESPMRISIAAVDRIAETSAELGINCELPDLVNAWLTRAAAQGLVDKELAALIEVLRGGDQVAVTTRCERTRKGQDRLSIPRAYLSSSHDGPFPLPEHLYGAAGELFRPRGADPGRRPAPDQAEPAAGGASRPRS